MGSNAPHEIQHVRHHFPYDLRDIHLDIRGRFYLDPCPHVGRLEEISYPKP